MHSRTRVLLSSIGLALGLVMAIALAYGCSGPPLAVFQASVSSGSAPVTVSLTNQSKNADKYDWDFGDGEKQATSTLTETVSHQYKKAGTFTVTMTASKKGNPPQTNSTTATVTVSPGPLATITIAPTQATLAPQGKQAFSAEARDEFGNVITDQKFSFKADDKAGQIDASGAFAAGKKAGSYGNAVTVEAVQGSTTKSATANITVTPGPLDYVVLNSTKATLNIGKTQDFSVSTFDAFDNPVTGARVAWSADKTAGTVDNGKLTAGTQAGSFDRAATVTATQGSATATATASLTVKPDPLDSVVTSDVQVQAGGTQQLKAAAKDKYGNPLSDVQFAWTVKNDDAGSVTASGSLTGGMVVGPFSNVLEMKATQGDIVKTVNNSVTVIPGPLAQVVVGPGQIDLGMGMSQQFVAVGADQYGNRISGLSFTWSVESGGGTIDSKGLFTASGTQGTYNKTIKALAKQGDISQSGTANVTVIPDRIAFFSTRENKSGDLYVMNSDGSNVVRISEGLTGTTFIASWSPDGRRLALDGSDPTIDVSSIVISDDKGDWGFPISGNQDASYPAWSPDGKRIAYTGVIDGHVEIFVMDADGGNATRLTNNTSVDYLPAWSPDGKKLAFSTFRDGNYQIYTMNVDGSGQTRLVGSSTRDIKPSWSPDGTKIVFQRQTTSTSQWTIWVVNADGTGLTQLTALTYSSNSPSWSADGKLIIFHSFKDSSTYPGVYSMAPDGTNIKRISSPTVADYGPTWAPRKQGVDVNEASIIITNSKATKPLTVQQVATQARKAVVRIEVTLAAGTATGSGFIIDPSGLIMTANHMVTDAKTISVTLDDGTKHTATVKGRDLVHDIALIQITATGLPYLALGDLSQSSLGQQVVVLGFPLGSKDLSVTSGLVSAMRNDPSRNITWVQTDSAINPGNSGGPLLNLQGQVVGVVTQKIAGFGVEGIGYAVSANTIDIYLSRLKDGQTIYK